MNHLFDWQDVGDEEWEALIARGIEFSRRGPVWEQRAAGKSVGLVFFNPSLRTRASMDLACSQLGGHALSLEPGTGTWGIEWRPGVTMDGSAAEHVTEAFGVLSRYFDALGVRVFAAGKDYDVDRKETVFRSMIKASRVPVINLESAFYHPCQALADAVTLQRRFDGNVAGRKFVLQWCCHPRALPMAVPNSTLLMATRLGFDVTLAHPPGFDLDEKVVQLAEGYARSHGRSLRISHERQESTAGAHVIYAKAWGGRAAYESPDEELEQRRGYADWRVTEATMQRTNEALCMHPLPVRRNVVIDDAVLDGDHAVHLEQAENRIHAQKAVLERAWGLL